MNLRSGFVGVSALAILHAWPGSAAAQSGVTTYTYDAFGQLVSSTNPAGQTTTYTYDQAGNRLSLSTVSVSSAPTVGNVNLTASFDYLGAATLAVGGQYTSLTAGTPANGTASINGITATYTPNTNFYGSDSFTYAATGPGGTSSPATVNVTVPQPPPPIAANVSTSVAVNSSDTITLAPRGFYSHIAVSAPAHGSIGANWITPTYAPSTGYSGPDSFTYTATGAGGTSNTATVSLAVGTASTVAPAVGNVNLTAVFETASTVPLTPTGSYTSLAVATGPAHGTASITGTTATYTSGNYAGADSFTYTATGSGGTSSPGTVNVTIPAPAPPTATNVSVSVGYNSSGNVVSLAPSGFYSQIAVSNPGHGTVSPNFVTPTYTPTKGYSGFDSFTYTATGAGGTSNAATVNVTVASASAPTVGNVNLTATFDYQGTATLTPAGQYTSLAVGTTPNNGAASITGTTATYKPNSNFVGSDTFTYTATGSGGTSSPATVSVTVPKPAPPTAGTVNVSIGYNTAGIVNLAPSGFYSQIAVSNPGYGTVSPNFITPTYTPKTGYSGTDSFTYTASGAGGTSSPGTVNVTVSPQGGLSASLNQTSWAQVGTAVSGNTVVTPTGGTPGYTYAWSRVSGFSSIAISSASAQSVYWTSATNPTGSTDYTAVWQCVVTDSAGHTFTTPQVTVDWQGTGTQ